MSPRKITPKKATAKPTVAKSIAPLVKKPVSTSTPIPERSLSPEEVLVVRSEPAMPSRAPLSLEPEPAMQVENPPARTASLRLYRRIAIGFVVLVTLLLAIVLYVSTVQATIRVVPVEETLSTEFLLDVVPTPTRAQEIRGAIVSGKVSRTDHFAPSGEGAKEVEGTARGTVTIYNTTDKSQALIATTRLLTSEGVLFRIDSDVTVPAQGSVQVKVHADAPGKAGDIGPSSFTIPGLSASLQKVIYADSREAFTGGLSMVSAVSQADIDRAIADLKGRLEEDAKSMLRTEAGEGLEGESFTSTILEQLASVEPGSEASTFDVTLTLDVTGVFFDKAAASTIAERELYAKLTPGKAFEEIHSDALQASVEKVDTETSSVSVRVYLDGRAISSLTTEELSPDRFAGMKEKDVRELLTSEGIAQDVSIEFFPPWVKTVPRLKDHIYVEIP